MLHSTVHLFRRLNYALIMVTCRDVPCLQASLINMNSLTNLIYLIYFKPFNEKKKNNLEIINECFILVTSYSFLLLLSQTTPMSYENKSFIGYFQIVLVTLMLTINLGYITAINFIIIFEKIKARLVKKK